MKTLGMLVLFSGLVTLQGCDEGPSGVCVEVDYATSAGTMHTHSFFKNDQAAASYLKEMPLDNLIKFWVVESCR